MTISCAERGLLALRVRDEVRMTVSAYQSLYESSIAFGIRKALMAEQRRFNEGKEMEELLAEIEKLEVDRFSRRRSGSWLVCTGWC